jgi:UrcA family protein
MFTTASTTVQRTVIGSIGTLLFAGICLAGAAAPAFAAEAPRVQTVSYADLNLANAAGREALDQRIKAAAESVCSTGRDEAAAKVAESRCVRDAITTATAVIQG